jgi:hypothetical protein
VVVPVALVAPVHMKQVVAVLAVFVHLLTNQLM